MMISTERLLQYTELPQEPPLSYDADPLAANTQRSSCCQPSRSGTGTGTTVEMAQRQLPASIEGVDLTKFSIVFDDLCVRCVLIPISLTDITMLVHDTTRWREALGGCSPMISIDSSVCH